MTYQLFKRSGKGFEWYAWANPDGVCFTSRMRSVGNGLVWGIIAPSLEGKTVKELKADGFKEARTKMTQEQLAKGWLIQ